MKIKIKRVEIKKPSVKVALFMKNGTPKGRHIDPSSSKILDLILMKLES